MRVLVGETDLGRLLAGMSPVVRPGRYVFTTLNDEVPGLEVLASVVELEGRSVVINQADADRLGLATTSSPGGSRQVHSALSAIGLTAAVSNALAEAGISCNVVAGRYHDHLLVPFERLDEAMAALGALRA